MSRAVRLSALAVVAGLLLAVPALTSPAAASTSTVAKDSAERARTCLGHKVTLVGRKNRRLTGTPHRDVILTNGAGTVLAGGGDDLICVNKRSNQRVSAGPGDDRVVVTGKGRFPGRYELGQGRDRFQGGSLRDVVWADTEEYVLRPPADAKDQKDVIRTGAGRDEVHTGSVRQRLRDHIHTGGGRDAIYATNPWQLPGAVLDGGGASDLLWLSKLADELPLAKWKLDNRRQVLRQDNHQVLFWFRLERFHLDFQRRSAIFLGSGRAEYFSVHPGERVNAGGGNDEIDFFETGEDGTAPLTGGPGRDRLTYRRTGAVVTGDLAADRISDEGGLAQPIPGIEDLWIHANQVHLIGDGGPNDLGMAYTCSGTVRAGAGNDVVHTQTPVDDEEICAGPSRFEQYGGAGDDRLVGAFAADELLNGGPGHDRANGKGGHDVCVEVEVARHCTTG